jgi:hypothetical protein
LGQNFGEKTPKTHKPLLFNALGDFFDESHSTSRLLRAGAGSGLEEGLSHRVFHRLDRPLTTAKTPPNQVSDAIFSTVYPGAAGRILRENPGDPARLSNL